LLTRSKQKPLGDPLLTSSNGSIVKRLIIQLDRLFHPSPLVKENRKYNSTTNTSSSFLVDIPPELQSNQPTNHRSTLPLIMLLRSSIRQSIARTTTTANRSSHRKLFGFSWFTGSGNNTDNPASNTGSSESRKSAEQASSIGSHLTDYKRAFETPRGPC